jgi:DNA-binding NtrC family response regulator
VELEQILVVDDEEAIREVVSTMLESKGYRCTAVSNGRAAQEQVKRSTPDLVLSDMIMPEMDGIRLLDWLREYDPEIPVIMVTAIHDISTALEAIRRGAYDYILKPFEKDQLFLGVGRALQHRRLVAENRSYQLKLEQQVEERTAELNHSLARLKQSYDDTLEALGHACSAGLPGHSRARCFSPRHRQDGHP